MAGQAADPQMPVSAQENARNKPRLRKEAELPDKDLQLRLFGPDCPDLSFQVTRFGLQIEALATSMHQYRALQRSAFYAQVCCCADQGHVPERVAGMPGQGVGQLARAVVKRLAVQIAQFEQQCCLEHVQART